MPPIEIKKAAVIGAGTMGSGIASHLTNAGIPVVLLDLPSDDDRNAIVHRAIARLNKSPAFMHPDNCGLITPGNIEDDMDQLADVDWIAEAVVERIEVKRAIYRQIDAARKPGSIVSSNTSTIPLATLTEGMPASFRQDFCITHFFNPVRHMRLLEMVAGPDTRPELIEGLANFCDQRLGKGVVHCKDEPGFLGNRVGVYAIQCAIEAAIDMGLTVEEADAIMGRPLGFPKTGVFALYDLIGLDLMLDVVDCLRDALPADDPFNQLAADLPLINRLVEQGYTGNKGAGGFYRRGPQGKEAVDLRTGEYRGLRQPAFNPSAVIAQGGLRALLEHDSPGGRFAAHVLGKTLAYAASLVPDVSAQVLPVDEAMKLGFNWTHGPFELLDQLSVDWFVQRLRDQGEQVPDFLERLQGGPLYRIASGRVQLAVGDGEYAHLERLPGVQRLADVTRPQEPLASNSAATLWDLGDGVACVEFHTKANALEQKSMDMLREATSIVGDRYQALVIHNDAPHFSMGANLPFFLQAAREAAWDSIEQMLAEFQQTCYGLKNAPFPVIGAPAGMALGGGCEVLLHCDALYAHANTVCGLVETSVGLIPAGGGCKEMLWRWSDADDLAAGALQALRLIGGAVTAGSPVEALPMRFFREHDRWVMNRDRVLLGAKAMALAAVPDYAPPAPAVLATGGAAAWDRMMAALDDRADELTTHDRFVNERLATVLVGGDRQQPRQLQEDELFALEREMFRKLIETPETQARIDHTLRTGKPLRN